MAKKAIFINEAGFSDCTTTTYTSNSPSTCTIGGIIAGTTLTGKTLECIIKDAFAPYIEPTFSAFCIVTTCPAEVGSLLNGSKSFSWSTTTFANVAASSIGIVDVTSGVTLATGFNYNDSPQSVSIGTKDTSSPVKTFVWQITGCSTQGTPFTRNKNVCTIYPYFWGVETCGTRPVVTNDLITGGSKVVNTFTTSVSVTFNSSSQWTWFAMPSNCAPRTKWFQGAAPNCGDINVIPTDKYPDEVCVNVSSPDGCWSAVEYRVYMSGSAWTDGSTPIQFRTY